MPPETIIACHYCGITKKEFEQQSASARGLYVTYISKDETTTQPGKKVWFCSRVHADFWIDQYRDQIEVLKNE